MFSMPSTTVLVVVCFRRRLDRWGSATDCLCVHNHLPEPCVLAEPVLSFKTQHIRAKPGRRCVGRPASEARPGGHTPRPRAEHGCADPPSPPHFLSEIAAHASLSSHRNGETVTFEDDRSFFTVFSLKLFGTFRVGVFRPQGFLHLCAFGFRDSLPALSRGFFPLLTSSAQTSTAPRAPRAGEIVRGILHY